jgi:hypothetical protein
VVDGGVRPRGSACCYTPHPDSLQSVHDVSVTGRVESRVVRIGLLGDRQQGVLAHSRVLGLVEGEDVDVVVGYAMAPNGLVCQRLSVGSVKGGKCGELTVFLNDTVGIGGSVETRHEDERHVAVANKAVVSPLISTCESTVPPHCQTYTL